MPSEEPRVHHPPELPSPAAPGRLAIELEHHLRGGSLQVWVDGKPILQEKLDSRVTRKILSLELRQGRVQEVLELEPGRHDIRVMVQWDKNTRAARIGGTFEPGATRRLQVKVGRLRGNLSLDWR